MENMTIKRTGVKNVKQSNRGFLLTYKKEGFA
jgi:hypothetical protein